jgi:hypothetical protein
VREKWAMEGERYNGRERGALIVRESVCERGRESNLSDEYGGGMKKNR